ncbi:LytR family transcriptional regulator [Streptomyces fodineus]|uniref:LytR family transcriptional regulator n=1 Tax=Streptomyces fodineus TaxID=1904616 RepID=A0A1D7YED2_9ACTN|nr:LCP family protein [Streptomyces fodineus]AOR33921.1 LytR family transcriptional regulator [Streptomyces fodineus]
MDTSGPAHGDDFDPADQWVRNPHTGEYELRPAPSAGKPAVPEPRSAPDAAGERGVPGPRRAADGGRSRGRSGAQRKSGKQAAGGKSTAKRILLWTGGTLAFVVVAGAVGGYLYLKHLDGNITTTDTAGATSDSFSKDKAFNILVIGTDKRQGKGDSGYGDTNSVGHADTDILLHVSQDRTNATALSIPRDLVTDIPDCPTKQPDGSTKVIPGTKNVRFNESLGQQGRDPGCTVRTVERLAGGMKVDHFMMADFNAVKTLTTAVGGVDICLAHAVKDKESHLDLPAGPSKVQGEQALAFVRTRHSWANESDLDRIKAQQQFLGSLFRKMKSDATLTSPTRLLDLAETATKSLTVDKGIGHITTLKDVALELKKVPAKNITFLTLPVRDNPADGRYHKTVIAQPGPTRQVFSMIGDDVSFTEVKKKAKAQEAAQLKGPRSAPGEVRVDLYNAGAPAGSAQATLAWLQTEKGVTKSTQLGNTGAHQPKTTLEYAPAQAGQARELADLMGLPASALKPGKSETNDQGLPAIVLRLGADFQGAGIPLTGPAKAPDVQKQTADQVKCAS